MNSAPGANAPTTPKVAGVSSKDIKVKTGEFQHYVESSKIAI